MSLPSKDVIRSPACIPAFCAALPSPTAATYAPSIPVGVITDTPKAPCWPSATVILVSSFIRSLIRSITSDIGIAKPIPSTVVAPILLEVTPITSPAALRSAPPELPGFIAASV